MFGLPISFAAPFVLTGLLLLPVIWWLLRLMPPRPFVQAFPPTRLLAEIAKKEDTPDKSPWWLTLLRLSMAAAAIIALAGPLWNASDAFEQTDSPLIVVVDNGWTSARDWPDRVQTVRSILEEADQSNRPVALVMTADPANVEIRLEEAKDALERFSAQSPQPYPEDRALTAERLKAAIGIEEGQVIWVASNLASNEDQQFSEALQDIGDILIRYKQTGNVAVTKTNNGASSLDITLKRLEGPGQEMVLRALDKDGLSLADVPIAFEGTAKETTASVTLPVELRNQIAQLSLTTIEGQSLGDAGSTYLIDDSSKRRKVGLVSGVSVDLAQPLLSPLYYINRALEPFAEIREADTANLARAIPALLQGNISIMIMADVGTLPQTELDRLRTFIEKGGTVVRFAGPRLASTTDTLTPVALREGERSLGGSLTWEQPQKLARFSQNGPFAGMNLPDDIEIRRQVLAEPDFDLLQKTWAELEDGTPLVTAEQIGDGWLVLFHVTADATWSNLPISGAFVEMLTKLVAFSSVPAGAVADEQSGEAEVLPPFQTIDATGRLGSPDEAAEPIALSDLGTVTATPISPPGYYGKQSSLFAHNLMTENTHFESLNPSNLLPESPVLGLGGDTASDLRGPFFMIMMALLLIDAVVVAAMAGALSRNPLRALTSRFGAAVLALFVAIPLLTTDSKAQQDDDISDFAATLTTRLAYVVTGDDALDDVSRAGLVGLTNFLSQRTALEPGEPVGVDIKSDELAFYPLLYWPITENAEAQSPETMARIDAFMKQGGTVLFDTKDQVNAGIGGTSPATLKLREIVSNLDIPPLEPVPANHVLTRAFYLLQDFPGRWIGSPLWVEATEGNENVSEETRSQADGVSSVLITANDFAGAWAVDETYRPLLPTVPSDPNQRVYAYRTGVNIVMYTLTGNYKADQVHIPALLERLGQ